MTPKERAIDIVDKFQCDSRYDQLPTEIAKIYALKAVYEIIRTLNYDIRDLDVRGSVLLDLIKYWEQVQEEIELL